MDVSDSELGLYDFTTGRVFLKGGSGAYTDFFKPSPPRSLNGYSFRGYSANNLGEDFSLGGSRMLRPVHTSHKSRLRLPIEQAQPSLLL